MKKLLVGLTGGIASGKSTVGKFFKSYGVPVIDADDVSRETTIPGSPLLAEVVACFGSWVLTPEGTLDRKALGGHIFANQTAREDLNRLSHPHIWAKAQEHIQAAMETPSVPYVLFDAALHVETGLYKKMDKLVVISVDPELQVRRLIKRNSLTEEQARARVGAQASLSERLAHADLVILNDNDKEALERRTRKVHDEIMKCMS